MTIEKEIKNVSAALLFKILHEKVLQVLLKIFF